MLDAAKQNATTPTAKSDTSPRLNLRIEMPETYAFIEACREAFSKESINPQIKLGMEGAQTFHASENGIEVGTRSPSFDDLRGITPDRMVLRDKVTVLP